MNHMSNIITTNQVRAHTLLVAWSHIDPLVFTLADEAAEIDGLDQQALERLTLELAARADSNGPLDEDLLALASDLAGQTLVLADEIEDGALVVPHQDINLFFVSMLGLALCEFGDSHELPLLHEDAAELGVLRWEG